MQKAINLEQSNMNANEYYKKLLARQFAFLNVDKYHEMGYKGQGYTVVNAESLPGKDGHGEMTTGVLNDFIPEARIINSLISGSGRDRKIFYQGEYIPLEDAIVRFNIKVFTSSHTASKDKITLDYYKELQERYGVIFFSCAGNEAGDGVRNDWNRYNTAIAVGAAQVKENGTIERMYYSSIGDELDFMCFMGRGTGTSSATPALTSFAILLMQRYGDMNQAEIIEVFKSLCVDMDIEGWDKRTGWGLPVLPLTDNLEILEKLRGENMDFKDVEKDRWSKPAIDRCVAEGLLVGFEDGTFRPTENVTREQFAQILVRILDKIK